MADLIKNRESKVLHTPRGAVVQVKAHLVTGKTVLPFECACRPSDGHDHEKMMADWMAMLRRREAVIDQYRAQEGRVETIRGVVSKITDCKIRPLGPMNFELCVCWTETVAGAECCKEFRIRRDVPDGFPPPAELIATMRAEINKTADEIALVNAEAARFLAVAP